MENREWISVSGIMRVVFDEAMDRDIPVVKVTGLKKIDPPDEEFISLV